MHLIPFLYEETEYEDPETGELHVRCRLASLEVKQGPGGERSYYVGPASYRCETDGLASAQPRDARLRAPLFAQMEAYLAAVDAGVSMQDAMQIDSQDDLAVSRVDTPSVAVVLHPD